MRKNTALTKSAPQSALMPLDVLKIAFFGYLFIQFGLLEAILLYFINKVLFKLALRMVCPKLLAWDPSWDQLRSRLRKKKPSLEQQLRRLELIEARLDREIHK